ncbi:hypothetical protein QN277_016256 [Acacia crassicarpa]|uniref:Uncharacterized protein n=1 Tax=Acacia crassicarpa TaxID=499986 RepID=A0AAE1TBZ6_9FABA|nr:hypothetical protein QN277_016256 [Acacia crassicarpa]
MEIPDVEETPNPQIEEISDDAYGISPLAKISLHAILGRNSTSTLHFKGVINSKTILILIDNGSSHNFISKSLLAELGIKPDILPPFGVQIGDVSSRGCNSICQDLKVMI